MPPDRRGVRDGRGLFSTPKLMQETLKFAAITLGVVWGARQLYGYLAKNGGIPALNLETEEFFPVVFALAVLLLLSDAI